FLDITRTDRLERKVRTQAAQLREQAQALAAALKTVHGRLGKLENTLSQTQQQLFESEKLSAVGLLAASVAHDIRNILTPLSIEITLADQDDAPARAESLAAMRRQVDSLDLLTHRLLALAHPLSVERASTNLGAMLASLVGLLRPQAALQNVQIDVRCPRHLPDIQADSVQIDQVLVNLALNALQAMRGTNGGKLLLSGAARTQSERPGICLRVRDTGPGISPTVRRRLFDPFFSTKPDGAGLGLFSCRRIVQEHGGTLTVRSGPRRGTEFVIWLPCGKDTVHVR
ncbi:MAG: ATP-binding protein, partial [Armatimonadota bacterium]|nr:ATP-binding protein [Armatimonadota bacterium]